VGVVTADVVKDQSRTVMLEARAESSRNWKASFASWNARAGLPWRAERFPDKKQHHERSLAVRYKGQSFELQIKQRAATFAAAFHRAHRARYGYAQEKNVVEIVSAPSAVEWLVKS